MKEINSSCEMITQEEHTRLHCHNDLATKPTICIQIWLNHTFEIKPIKYLQRERKVKEGHQTEKKGPSTTLPSGS